MNRIEVLDNFTVGQIAAGEVVQRPVSVVKELVENSLDAGADQVVIEITEGGKKGIIISDNGIGIRHDDIKRAFYRHATSKIASAGDLYQLSTLGFRGEALPSIAAVSDLILVSRSPSEQAGQKIHLKGGDIISVKAAGCPPGTSVSATDLFFNTPARRKHLKSTGTESSLVADIVQRMSLARPEVRFVFKNNDRVVFRSPGSGKLIDAVSSVYNVELAKYMVEVDEQNDILYAEGLLGKPSFNRKTRSHIYLIINGRYVRNKAIYQAVDEAYSGLILSGRHPVAVISLQLNPALLDVNIHPAKMEIKIDKENEIADLLKCSIREKLKNTLLIPTYKSYKSNNTSKKEDINESNNITSIINENQKKLNINNKDDNFIKIKQDDTIYNLSQDNLMHEKESEQTGNKITNNIDNNYEEYKNDYNQQIKLPYLQVIGQLLPTYIVAGGPDGLYIIDQHAAHERIMYEKLLNTEHENNVQWLLTPVPLELSYSTSVFIQDNILKFKQMGFIIEEFGEETYIIRAVPAHLSTNEGIIQFTDLIEEIAAAENNRENTFWDKFITSLSCRAAVKSGEILSNEVMNNLVNHLSMAEEPYTCPHGRPTLVKITENELLQMFKRTN
ncbi:MAG: DNA mismatch repair endonuclease MutL [Clostridiales bacterium]|nr:DNA mismatch repair endonuclease MutL [Clostridiales bacterium]MCF8023267.1 DNA mismatch repair endonuclease MutL [Clostridiales bacterium]